MRNKRDKRLNLRVSADWYDLVAKAAKGYGLSMTDVIMYATRHFLEMEPPADITFAGTPRARRKK